MSKTVDEYLNTVSYADNDTYVPSEFSLMVVNLIKQINGETGEENKTPVVHFKMLDNMIKPGNVANLCHRGLAKTTLFGEYMLPIIAILGGLPGFGDIKYALYVADSIENGVRSMRKNLEYRYENSPFLKKYLKAKFTETSWEFTNVDGHQLVVDAFGAKTGIRGTKKLGTRPQLLILDDLLSDDDARSPVVLKSVEDTLTRAIKYAMHPHSKIIWCGTPFNKKDPLYRAVESGIYNVNVYPICEKFPCSKSEFRGSWEDRFPYEYVKKQYEEAKALGAVSSFNQELMLRIMTDEERLILDSDIMWYSRKLLLQHKDDYNFYITTDFATSDKQSADFSVISVWAYNCNGDFFWVDGIVRKQLMNKNYDDLFMLVQTYKPLLVGVEVTGQQGGFISTIVDLMTQRNIYFNLAGKPGSFGIRPIKDKMTRFNVVLPWFKLHKMYFPKEYMDSDRLSEAMDELFLASPTGFKSKHDDFIDTISMLGDMYPQMFKPSTDIEMKYNTDTDTFDVIDETSYNEEAPIESYVV